MVSTSPNDPEDERYTHGLLLRLQSGDTDAANELFAVHRERLLRAIRHNLAPEKRFALDEEELVQATLHKALGRLGQFTWRGKGAFLAWLVRMAVNLMRDELRRTPPGRENARDVLANTPVIQDTPSEAATSQEEQLLLERALDQLEELDRSLIVNRKILKQDYRSLAEDMNMTEGAVRMRVHRVMNRLTRWVELHS